MEYIPELFMTDRRASLNTRYQYEYSGAFYDVYTDGDGILHMDIRERRSLMERMKFYEKFISQSRDYPVYTKREGRITSGYDQREVLLQVLGLPDIALTSYDKESNTYVPLSCEEILESIHFEKGLYHVREKLSDIRKNVLKTNDPSIISAINYLIENGIYLLNPERIYDMDDTSGQYYPVFIDEESLPYELKKEKETSEKLFMDFADDLLSVDCQTFTRYFRKADSMSLSELCDYAFNQREKDEDKNAVIFRNALRRYFLSMAKIILNEYYDKFYGLKRLFSESVLVHDLGFYQISNDRIYMGSRFNMYVNFRTPVITRKEDGTLSLEDGRDHYIFDSYDRKHIIRTYDMVHRYFAQHPELKYMPMLYVKLMGLPYPALMESRFFDFRNSTGADFVKQFGPYDTDLSYESYGYMTPTCLPDGSCEMINGVNDSIIYHLYYLIRKGLFISDPMSALGMNTRDYFILFDNIDDSFRDFITGDSDLYKTCMELFQFSSSNDFISKFKTGINTFFLEDADEGKLKSYQRFFGMMNQGFTARESYSKAGFTLSYPVVQALLDGALFRSASEGSKETYDKIVQKSAKSYIYTRILLGKNYQDETTGYFIDKGMNFLGYRKLYGGEVMDSSDRERIITLISVFDSYFRRGKAYPYSVSAYGKEIPFNIISEATVKRKRIEFLGLPYHIADMLDENKDILSQIPFVDGISIFSKKEYLPVIEKDDALKAMMIFHTALDRGVYLNTLYGSSTPIYYCPDKLSEEYKKFFDPEFMMIMIKGSNRYHQFFRYDEKSKLDVQKILRSKFDTLLSTVSRPGIEYASYLKSAITDDIKNELFAENTTRKLTPYIVKDRKGQKLYVSPGLSFYAYSRDGIHFFFDSKDKEALSLAYRAVTADMESQSITTMTYALGLPFEMIKKTYDVLQHVSLQDFDLTSIFDFEDVDIDIMNLMSRDGLFFVSEPDFSESILHTQERNQMAENGIYYFPNYLKITEYTFDDVKDDLDKNFGYYIDLDTYASQTPKSYVKDMLEPTEMAFSSLLERFFRDIKTDGKYTSNTLFYAREFLENIYMKNKQSVIEMINRVQFSHCGIIDLNFFDDLKLAEVDDVSIPLVIKVSYMFAVYLQCRIIEHTEKKLLSRSKD